MALYILLVFIVVPLIEIALFIEIGDWIGLWPTLAAIVLTALAGTALLRIQGLTTLARARAEMDRGELPARELFDAFCLVIAGVLLLVPGFFTDAIGLLLFVPPFRNWLRRILGRNIQVRSMSAHGYGQYSRGQEDDRTIDAEYVDVTGEERDKDTEEDTRELHDKRSEEDQSGKSDGSKWVR